MAIVEGGASTFSRLHKNRMVSPIFLEIKLCVRPKQLQGVLSSVAKETAVRIIFLNLFKYPETTY